MFENNFAFAFAKLQMERRSRPVLLPGSAIEPLGTRLSPLQERGKQCALLNA